jgi:hypothetical protein
MLNDHSVNNTPDVNVSPRDRSTRRLRTREQSHGRGPVAPVDRHVVDDEVALSDDVMMIDSDLFTKIVNQCREDLSPALSALRTSQIVLAACCVVHQVFGDKFVDDSVITSHNSTK